MHIDKYIFIYISVYRYLIHILDSTYLSSGHTLTPEVSLVTDKNDSGG
jgi:hypothetical protein